MDPTSDQNVELPLRASFGQQARWNTALSAAGQIIAVAFVTVASRLLGREGFGHYVWITALPGLFVIFDLFLGQALQNRLTELYAIGRKAEGDVLLWAFMWVMLAASIAFAALAVLFVGALDLTGVGTVGALPLRILWLGVIYLICSGLNVPLLAAHLAYNANGALHRNALLSFGAELLTRAVFLIALVSTRSFEVAVASYSVSLVIAQIIITARFLTTYNVKYIGPSRTLIRSGLRDLWIRGNARDWAVLRIVDAVYKNSELVVGTLVIGAATVGDFALLDRLSSALMLAANSIYVPLVPALVSASATNERGRMSLLSAQAIRYSIAGLVLFSVFFLSTAQPLASLWAGRRIHFPFFIVALICARSWTRVLSSLGWHLLAGHQLIRMLLWATAASGFVYLLLYGLTLTRYGVTSIVASQIIAQLLFISIARKYGSAAMRVVERVPLAT